MNITINLTAEEYEELESLEDGQEIEVVYKGIDAYITPDEYGNIEYKGRRYTFNFFCPSEVKMRVEKKKEDSEIAQAAIKNNEDATESEDKDSNSDKKKTKTILAADFDPKKYHIYDVKTTGRHPVHLIDAGGLLTEDDGDYGSLDMYWFYLNQREYELFKKNLHEVEVEVC